MKTLLQDLAYAFRQLRKAPGFTLTALLSLACGIAATTAVFSVVWAVLVNPYPYSNSDRMAHLALGDLSATGDYDGFATNPAQWQQLRTIPAVEDAVLTRQRSLTISGGDLPEDVGADYMTSNAFNFFGVPPILGRGLQPADAVGGADPAPVVVLGYKFWQRRFHADAAIVGQTIYLQKKPYTVIGVAAPRFTWGDADVYLPMKLDADPKLVGSADLRIRPGIPFKLATQQLQPLISQFAKDTPQFFPDDYPHHPKPLHIIGLNEQFIKALGPTLALLFAAVALLLAIGCGNVSILLLARGTSRQHEFAIRAAIGASRARIVRQLLTESLLLSISGAALGVLLSYKLLAIIVSLLPINAFPHEASIHINLPVLVFCTVIAFVTGVVFGLYPALQLSRPDVRDAMQAGTTRVVGNSSRTLHNVLIGTQIALTLVLLSTAGTAVRAFLRLAHMPLGYDPHHVMSVGLPIHESDYTNIAARDAFVEALRNKVAATPGVREVGVSSNATPPYSGFSVPMQILGQPSATDLKARWNLVDSEYFSVLRIPLVQGRLWTESEVHNGAQLAIVNQAFVRKYFPSGNPIGHSVKTDALKPVPPTVVALPGIVNWMPIVGVIGDKLNQGFNKPIDPEVYIPYTMGMEPWSQLLVRTDGSPLSYLHAIGVNIASIDAQQQVAGNTRDLDHWLSDQPEYAQGQLISWLFAGFAALALLLSAVGLYSVVSYTVAQRTGEFGIRMALGALRGNVLNLVYRSTMVSIAGGIAAGVVLALILHRVIQHWIGGTSDSNNGSDIGSLALALLVLLLATAIASTIPAVRATRIEPMEALRYE